MIAKIYLPPKKRKLRPEKARTPKGKRLPIQITMPEERTENK